MNLKFHSKGIFISFEGNLSNEKKMLNDYIDFDDYTKIATFGLDIKI